MMLKELTMPHLLIFEYCAHEVFAIPLQKKKREGMEPRMRYSDIRIDKTSSRSRYLQVADGIVDAIMDGRLPVGRRLVSVRYAADAIGVNHKTIETAIDLLAKEGIVEKRARSGVYVLNASACALGRYFSKYSTTAATAKEANAPAMLKGSHSVSLWMEWDTLGPLFVDAVRQTLVSYGITAEVTVSHGGHPAVRLEQGSMDGVEFAALITTLQRLSPTSGKTGAD